MIAAFMLFAAASAEPISGTWEGTSLCQVKSSPCHDEHVIYRVTGAGPDRYRFDAYRIVEGKELFMGSIDFVFDAVRRELRGTIAGKGEVLLALKADELKGRLTLSDGTLFRLIDVTRR